MLPAAHLADEEVRLVLARAERRRVGVDLRLGLVLVPDGHHVVVVAVVDEGLVRRPQALLHQRLRGVVGDAEGLPEAVALPRVVGLAGDAEVRVEAVEPAHQGGVAREAAPADVVEGRLEAEDRHHLLLRHGRQRPGGAEPRVEVVPHAREARDAARALVLRPRDALEAQHVEVGAQRHVGLGRREVARDRDRRVGQRVDVHLGEGRRLLRLARLDAVATRERLLLLLGDLALPLLRARGERDGPRLRLGRCRRRLRLVGVWLGRRGVGSG
mmetsp:Transcript_30120/g.92927  ORF Transcript_30120/g.92927 Transcript_30120/m.92927 type:complete len:271 (-) Transcript_30120:48-860(-)